MKTLTSVSVIALAASLASMQARALSPAEITAARSAGTLVEVATAGASASRKTFGLLLQNFCDAATYHRYKDNLNGTGWNNYSCTLKTSAADPAIPAALSGKPLLVYTRQSGGSGWGVLPVARSLAVKFMDVTACTAGATPADDYTCDVSVTPGTGILNANGECSTTGSQAGVTCRVPDGGISDVEPALFFGSNYIPEFGVVTAADIAAFGANIYPVFSFVFGIQITDEIYRGLQQIQGILASTDPDVEANYTDPNLMPNLTTAEVNSILSKAHKLGDSLGWAEVHPDLTVTNSAGGTEFMSLCRRVRGSGTQAQANVHWVSDPCKKGGLLAAGATMRDASDDSAGILTFHNPGSGDVLDCLNREHNLGYGAIGINAIEKTRGTGDHFQFVKIDGVAPTRENAIKGDYRDQYESTMQWRASTSDPEILAVLNLLKDNVGDPALIAAGKLGEAAMALKTLHPAGDPSVTAQFTRGGNSCETLFKP